MRSKNYLVPILAGALLVAGCGDSTQNTDSGAPDQSMPIIDRDLAMMKSDDGGGDDMAAPGADLLMDDMAKAADDLSMAGPDLTSPPCNNAPNSCGTPGNCVDCSNAPTGHACVSMACGCNTEQDCPAGNACDPNTHQCSVKCAGPLTCNGGCCDGVNCVAGMTNAACGSKGGQGGPVPTRGHDVGVVGLIWLPPLYLHRDGAEVADGERDVLGRAAAPWPLIVLPGLPVTMGAFPVAATAVLAAPAALGSVQRALARASGSPRTVDDIAEVLAVVDAGEDDIGRPVTEEERHSSDDAIGRRTTGDSKDTRALLDQFELVAEGETMRRTRLIAGRRTHPDVVADRARHRLEHGDAGRVDTIVIGDENTEGHLPPTTFSPPI